MVCVLLFYQVEVNGEAKVIHRDYREILWLYRYLQRRVDLGGYIVSPLSHAQVLHLLCEESCLYFSFTVASCASPSPQGIRP